MPVWDNIGRAGRAIWDGFTKANEPRRRQSSAQAALANASGGAGYSGMNWTQDRNEQVRHFRTWTYIAIRALARQIAYDLPEVALRLDEWDEPQRQSFAHRRTQSKTKALTPLREHDELEMVGASHPLRQLFDNPNGPDTGFDLFYEHELFLGLCGISYWWIPPNALNLPAEAWVIPSPWVRPVWSGSNWIDVFEIKPYGSSTTIEIPPEQMVVFQEKHPWHKRDGWSPMSAGDAWIDSCDTVDALTLVGLRNGAFPSLAYEVDDKNYKEGDDAEMERILAKAKARLQGVHNTGSILFNRPGAKANTLSGVSGLEIGFINSRPQLRDQILSLYGVPYSVANIIGGSTYENFDQSIRGFHMGTVNPKKRWYGQVLTEKLAHRYDPRLVVYWKDATPVDPAIVNAEIDTDYRCRAISSNEIRVKRGREPWPEADYDRPPEIPEPVEMNGGEKKKPGAMSSRNGTAKHLTNGHYERD